MKTIKSIAILVCVTVTSFSMPGFAKEANQLTPHESYSLSGYPLTLTEAIEKTIAHNFAIEIARIQRSINPYGITAAKAVYDTTLTADVGYTVDNNELATSLARNKKNETVWDLGLSKKFSWGSLLSFDVTNKRNSSNANAADRNPYYQTSTSFSLTQPLSKNAFGLVDRGTIKLERLSVSKKDLALLTTIEDTVGTVIKSYWDLVFAYGNREVKKQALRFAEDFLAITKKQFEDGALEETDLFAAEANVEQRKSELLQAHIAIEDSSDILKFAMNFFPEFTLFPTDTPTHIAADINTENCLSTALRTRRDLQAAHIAVETQELTLKMNKNKRLPQIDLIGSFTANGLARELINAVGEGTTPEDATYYVGATASFPLENRTATAHTEQTELAKAQALLTVDKIEKAIAIDIHKSVRALQLHKTQAAHNERIQALQEKKLAGEEKKYGFGRSSSDMIIRFQTDYLNGSTALIKSLTAYEKALVDLKLNQHTLLDNLDGIEQKNK